MGALSVISLLIAIAGLYFDIIGAINAADLFGKFAVFDESFYQLSPTIDSATPTTQFCVVPAVLDDAFGKKKFQQYPKLNYPNLICSDDRLAPWDSGRSATFEDGSINSNPETDSTLSGKLLRSLRSTNETYANSTNTNAKPWVNSQYTFSGMTIPAFSYCPENYYCTRNRSAYGYPEAPDAYAGDFAFCIHKNLTCGNKQWCAQYVGIALEGDYDICEQCEGCLCDSDQVFISMIALIILSSLVGCCDVCAGCGKNKAEEDDKEGFAVADTGLSCCGMILNGIIVVVAFAHGTSFFFQKLVESSCLGPTGESIMGEVQTINDELYKNVLLSGGACSLVLAINIAEMVFFN